MHDKGRSISKQNCMTPFMKAPLRMIHSGVLMSIAPEICLIIFFRFATLPVLLMLLSDRSFTKTQILIIRSCFIDQDFFLPVKKQLSVRKSTRNQVLCGTLYSKTLRYVTSSKRDPLNLFPSFFKFLFEFW